MRFFRDNCLSPRWAPALSALVKDDGHQVIHRFDTFPRKRPRQGLAAPAGLQAIPHDLGRNRTAHTQQAADEHRDKIGPKQSASPAVGGSKWNLNLPRGRQRRDIVIRTAVTLPVTVNPNHRHDGRGKENKR